MTRRTAATVSAALTALATLCACTSTDATSSTDQPTTTQSSSATTPVPDEPTDLGQVPEDTPLEPGTYSVPFLYDDGPRRAVVEVPEGYTSFGSVIGSDEGDLAFWAKVTQVDTDPCLGGKHVSAGTSVRDLATALAAQRNMKPSRPVPVTLGGYHGVYLKLTAPANIDRCRGGSVKIYTAGGSWLELDVSGAVFNEWILNVHGQRVVAGTRGSADPTTQEELTGIVESAEFTLT